MLSYQNDPALKSRFMAHVTRHRELDSIEQGSYGHMRDGQWRGCAVACSLRSLDEIDGVQPRDFGNDHAGLAERLGIPLVLAYLQDQIFEGLPKEDALAWPSRFAAAIPVGRDLAMVWPKLALWLLSDPEAGVQRFAERDQTRESIARVAALFERHIVGDPPSAEEWRSARYAAAAARYAAAAAAAARYAAAAADDADDAAAAAAANAADAAAAARLMLLMLLLLLAMLLLMLLMLLAMLLMLMLLLLLAMLLMLMLLLLAMLLMLLLMLLLAMLLMLMLMLMLMLADLIIRPWPKSCSS